jgi:hypothetical protein
MPPSARASQISPLRIGAPICPDLSPAAAFRSGLVESTILYFASDHVLGFPPEVVKERPGSHTICAGSGSSTKSAYDSLERRENPMAYSDYGGYAYRNGVRVDERSDFTINAMRSNSRGHAVLGDGPIYLTLYKQSSVGLYRGVEKIDIDSTMSDKEGVEFFEEGDCYLDSDQFISADKPAVMEVDGWVIEVRFTHEDNHYVYAKVTQPDGTLWHGWSGYGVGAGLEGDGSSTRKRERMLCKFWPEAIL